MDGDHFIKNRFVSNKANRRETYRHGYVEKLEFANQGILSMVNRIISDADAPTIIIIHGDHGGGLHLTTTKSLTHASRSVFHPFSPSMPAMIGCSALFPTI